MTIKIRFHGDKAIIRWKTLMEREFLKRQMTMFRDYTPGAQITLKDEKGNEIPRIPRPQTNAVSTQVNPPVHGSGLNDGFGGPPTNAISGGAVLTNEAIVVKMGNEEKKDGPA